MDVMDVLTNLTVINISQDKHKSNHHVLYNLNLYYFVCQLFLNIAGKNLSNTVKLKRT
jgi:hypothetical protein